MNHQRAVVKSSFVTTYVHCADTVKAVMRSVNLDERVLGGAARPVVDGLE